MTIQELLAQKQPLLLYDGDCALCNHLIRFFLNREKGEKMNFAPLNSATANTVMDYFDISERKDSMVLIRNYKAYIKSCAALRLCLYMKGLWPLMTVFLIVPTFLRHPVYDFVAKRRLKWFGVQETCMNMVGFRKDRFLD